MSISDVTAGKNLQREFNVIIEIPMHGDPVKFEVDRDSGAFFVDRFMSTAMGYPCNYGYIPKTLLGDGDPIDVLVVCPFPLPLGVVLTCRPVGLLRMEDENGRDDKVLAVPIGRLTSLYDRVASPDDLPESLLHQISHFFAHYKDLEPGRFVRVGGFEGRAAAEEEISRSEEAYRNSLSAERGYPQ
jgi:inorganic pyrophosphatase